MRLDWKQVLRAGFLWAVIGVVLLILVTVLGPLLGSIGVGGVSLWSYAAMFAGVNFTVRTGETWLDAIVGGALAGLIAGALILLLEVLINQFTPLAVSTGEGLQALAFAGAALAGAAGGVGVKLSKLG